MLLRAWRAYIQTLNRWPTATQMVQGGFLMGTGDLAAQVLVDGKKRSELEAERAVRFAAIGTFFVAPIIRVWYSALERLVTPMSLSAARATVAKVALDQLAFAPPFQASIIAVIGLAQVMTASTRRRGRGHWCLPIPTFFLLPRVGPEVLAD